MVISKKNEVFFCFLCYRCLIASFGLLSAAWIRSYLFVVLLQYFMHVKVDSISFRYHTIGLQ